MKKKRKGGGDHRHHHYYCTDEAASLILRHTGHRLFPVVSAVSAVCLMVLAAFSFLSSRPPIINHHLPSYDAASSDSSLHSASHAAFLVQKNGGKMEGSSDVWRSSLSSIYYHGCSNATPSFLNAPLKTHPDRFLLISTSGGLNQQRTGITDAVVAAYILNATLVVPKLDPNSFWKDGSDFADIFDVDWFISFLTKDVTIIRQLPTKVGKAVTPYRTRVPRKCTPSCYLSRVLPLLNKKHAVHLRKFDYRLSNRLDMELQKLRCRVNYHALKFTNPILEMGRLLVKRMRTKSQHYIALHLRFESDMLAFSGCYYGGGEKERAELGAIRKRWKTLHASNPEKVRRHGRCPLTPEEVGLMLRALGFGIEDHIYVASGEVYGGEETLAPLKAIFPNFHSKDTLARKEELEPFSSFSSRMAALDFIVCDESDVFVTNNNGNMAKMLAGRRRYFGHKPTIRPNAKKLYKLFMNRDNTSWEEFASRVRTNQIGFMGEPNEVKPGRGEFHENPSSCICSDSEVKAKENLIPQGEKQGGTKTGNKSGIWNEVAEVTEEHSSEDDHELDPQDVDCAENGWGIQGKETPSDVLLDDGLVLKSEPGELDELFSD